jgi:uracil-DNA glycosylase family 4
MIPRCPDCPNYDLSSGHGFSPIPGDGPEPCAVLCVGAGPGKSENARRRAYAGPAGQELDNTYLLRGGLTRGETVYIDNLSKCWDGTDRTPPEKRVVGCAKWHMPDLLNLVSPQVLVLNGGVTCHIADPVPGPNGPRRLRLDLDRGVPYWGSVLGGMWTGWIWPMFEPALGLRDTPRMSQLLEDWRHFGAWMKGEWVPPKPDTENTDYQLVGMAADFAFGPSNGVWRPRVKWCAVDTENHGPKPWSVQWSQRSGQGRMVLAEDEESLALLRVLLPTVTVYLHNAPHDLDVLDKLGIHITDWRDTQQESYHLASLPQGLKPLVYRLFGYQMRGYQDVVWPHSVAALTGWMRKALAVAQDSLTDVATKPLVRGKCGVCGHQHSTGPCRKCTCVAGPEKRVFVSTSDVSSPVESVLRHVLRYTESTTEAEDPYNGWDALRRMRVEGLRGKTAEAWEWDFVEQECGPMPLLGIANVPLDEAVQYGVGDADWTGRVAARLEQERQSDRWKIAKEDYDA